MKRTLTLSLSLLILVVIALALYESAPQFFESRTNTVAPHKAYEISDEAVALHARLLVADMHADTLLWDRKLHKRKDYGHVDLPRMLAGGYGLQVFTTVTKVPAGQNYDENDSEARDILTGLVMVQGWPTKTWNSYLERALYQGRRLSDLAGRSAGTLVVVPDRETLANVRQRRVAGKEVIGAVLGTEGSHALEGRIENVDRLFDAGFRLMSLQHFFDNKLGGSLHGLSGAGLSQFGRDVVKKIEQKKIILDVSHSSEAVVNDVLEIASRPVVVTHTGFRGHCDSPRNISDALMKRIAEKGGVIGVGFWDAAVCDFSAQFF